MSTNYSGLQNYRILSNQIQNEFDQISQRFSGFQAKEQLGCLEGCGKCCFKPEIFATPLEMLPLALEIISRGEGEAIYQKCLDNKNLKCIFLKVKDETNYKGHCSEYKNRPLVCRTFGVSARHNKQKQIEYSACKIIKEERAEAFAVLLKKTDIDLAEVPFIDQTKSQIAALDPRLLEMEVQINEAMRIMLDKLLMYQAYSLDS